MSHTRHIALVGVTGVGKSTLLNVLRGNEDAEVNNNAGPCTKQAKNYEVVEGGIRYCIWDTRGLNEPSGGISKHVRKLFGAIPEAERELKKLLRRENPRFNLVVLCIDAKKIGVGVHWKIYNMIYASFCNRKLKVAVVATQLGQESGDSEWKKISRAAAKGVVKDFPDWTLMEAVPRFDSERPNGSDVMECKKRILALINRACL